MFTYTHTANYDDLQQPVSAPVGYLLSFFSNKGGEGNSLCEWKVHLPASVWGGSGMSIFKEWKEGWTGIVDSRFNGDASLL